MIIPASGDSGSGMLDTDVGKSLTGCFCLDLFWFFYNQNADVSKKENDERGRGWEGGS